MEYIHPNRSAERACSFTHNTTVFNDVIYDKSSGYRQERIRALGYRSDDWTGGLDVPRFYLR